MKLSHKLILAPVITAVVVLTTGQLDSFLLSRSGEAAVAAFDGNITELQNLGSAQGQVNQVHVDVYRMMTIIGSMDDAAQVARRKAIAAQTEGMKTVLSQRVAKAPADSALRRSLEAAQSQIDTYLKKVDLALDLASVDANTGVAAMQGADEAYTALNQSLSEVQAALVVHAKDGTGASAADAQRLHWLLSLFSLIAAVVVVALSWLMLRAVATALTRASQVASEVASGNLTVATESSRKDEIGALFEALGAMKTALVKTVGQVRQATDSITTASVQIAAGNQDLSARTEQTASNLQQTASSMEELTATVRQSADAARQANQLAASAAQIAARGGAVVGQVVTTMDEINHSSKKINDIIGVIDGIAFQTNILALNAAVEAARAGEQGRGFAVVAGEVRNLAQRSAEAAKEIKGLIGTSVGKVAEGSRLVADAGQTMNEIVGSVQRVSDIIGEITAAASEQSEGIGQVNTSVNQLDQMTQQNAALVEQSAAAAESLKEQAKRLSQVVMVFRIDGMAASPAPVGTALAPTPGVALPAPAPALKPKSSPQVPKTVSAPASAPRLAAPAVAAPLPAAKSVPVAKPAVSAGQEGDWESF
jgi:methyl-accepting chemotaxis protein